jgi:L-asparaginase
MKQKNVYIINTGGTISSIKTALGYQPSQGYVSKVMDMLPIFHHPDLPKFTIHEYEPLIDSSNITVTDWNNIAKDLRDNYTKYDGFIILHGTDTMAYTACALSFMLENLNKPVIITGSQIPLSEVRNDAFDNLITSMWLCVHHPIPEVCVYFNQRLLRGNRCQKVDAQSFAAFDSPNFPDIATIGSSININSEVILQKAQAAFEIQTMAAQHIGNFRLFPGFSIDVLESIMHLNIKALILETYGAGNAPSNQPEFLKLLQKSSENGIIIVNSTQCHKGHVEMQQYATGHQLHKAGVISGLDMTKEAIHCKLLYLFSKELEIAEIKRKMQTNLRGELSELR